MTDESNKLKLIGYCRCAGHGFAVPLYGMAEGANNVFLATCSTSGDHSGTVVAFVPVEADDQRRLPPGESVDVEIGEVWRDVFLWNEAVFVGTPGAIWAEISTFYSDLEARAPLSLLDLAVQASRPEVKQIAPVAMSFVAKRFGQPQAMGWRRQFLRQRAERSLRRALSEAKLPDAEYHSVELEEDGDGLRLKVSTAIAEALEASENGPRTLEGLTELGALLDVKVAPPDGVSLQMINSLFGDDPPVPSVPIASTGDLGDGKLIAEAPDKRIEGIRTPGSITLLSLGRRARIITNQLRSARNRDVGSHADDIDFLTTDTANTLDTQARNPETLIVVIDDDYIDQGRLPRELEQMMADEARRGSLVLLAPALPSSRPSALLASAGELGPLIGLEGVHAVLDTAIARSPFWWGKAKRSIDRRISDVIQIALSAVRNPALRRELLRQRDESMPILALGLLPEKGERNDLSDGTGNLKLGSEASWVDGNPKRSDADILFSIRMSLDGASSEPHDDRLIAEGRRRTSRFAEFATRVITPIVERRTKSRRNSAPRVEQMPSMPSDLRNMMRDPQYSAAFRVYDEDGDATYRAQIVLTAETPTLGLVEAADRSGWSIARYTDVASIRRRFGEPQLRTFPDELDLGELHSNELHRRLATRGVDQRDVYQVSPDQLSEWLAALPQDERAVARREGRLRRRATRPHSDPDEDILFTPEYLLSGSAAAQKLRTIVIPPEHASDRRQMRRQADLQECWLAPAMGLQRYAIVDGAVPIVLLELQEHEVPVEEMFTIDGDLAVPALFRSRVFAVWARATLPAASSWMARFSVTNTFGGFPLPRPFRIESDTTGRAALTLVAPATPIADLATEISQHIERVQASQPLSSWKEAHRVDPDLPAMRRLNDIILSAYGLASEVDDIQILRRLLDLNERLG